MYYLHPDKHDSLTRIFAPRKRSTVKAVRPRVKAAARNRLNQRVKAGPPSAY